ncbi:YmdB family metallophosphoesterase [Candidatus Saccharibacteria bacterium]|nr:YmdB family metallophosphoesterase [Candidatus Saccharibacteria bacterium]
MNILYIGDIMGQPGMGVVERVLPDLIRDRAIDIVIAQAENVTDGKGMSVADMDKLSSLGVNFFTGGNHTPKLTELYSRLEDESQPVIGPANIASCPGAGYKYLDTQAGKILVVSLMGEKVGQPIEMSNPLVCIDDILRSQANVDKEAVVVNFHGDYSSEKRIIGYYLDGRVSMVVGDHWHVPTADAMILPNGTAHVTDVGMCGSLNSSLGVTFDSIIPRWRDGIQTANELEMHDTQLQFNAVLMTKSPGVIKSDSIERIQVITPV